MKDKMSLQKGYRARTLFVIFNYIFFILVMGIMIVPLLKVFVDSVDPTATYGMRLIPKEFSLGAYQHILGTSSLYRPFFVSIFTTIVGTVIGLAVTTIGAYVIIQEEMPGRKLFVNIIMFTMLFSGGLIPTYLAIKQIGLLDSIWAVILPLSINAYNIILMKSFFQGLPQSLFEAAEIDGCTPIGTFTKIVLPLSKPALASVGLFIAVAYWNDFFHFQIYINNPNWQNFQVKVRELILSDTLLGTSTGGSMPPEMLKSATIVVVMAPFLFIYPFLQKYFVKGITLGAVKG
ncbi:MAG: carbohydrate ABC transporter permease [Niameybacter sp.]|uniref:carbohydrate ABC transporter permease n=1 Tax=Niameybacter sp. TaxID=2033640 RepID=UPI002FC91F47